MNYLANITCKQMHSHTDRVRNIISLSHLVSGVDVWNCIQRVKRWKCKNFSFFLLEEICRCKQTLLKCLWGEYWGTNLCKIMTHNETSKTVINCPLEPFRKRTKINDASRFCLFCGHDWNFYRSANFINKNKENLKPIGSSNKTTYRQKLSKNCKSPKYYRWNQI